MTNATDATLTENGKETNAKELADLKNSLRIWSLSWMLNLIALTVCIWFLPANVWQPFATFGIYLIVSTIQSMGIRWEMAILKKK